MVQKSLPHSYKYLWTWEIWQDFIQLAVELVFSQPHSGRDVSAVLGRGRKKVNREECPPNPAFGFHENRWIGFYCWNFSHGKTPPKRKTNPSRESKDTFRKLELGWSDGPIGGGTVSFLNTKKVIFFPDRISIPTYTNYVWYIYLHVPENQVNVGQYTSPMDPMGYKILTVLEEEEVWIFPSKNLATLCQQEMS